MDTAAASRVARIIRDQELFREACYISGPWRPAVGAATISVDDPATGRGHRRCPEIRPRRDARGPRRCGAAYPAWPKRTPKECAAVLRRWSELILANQDDLARLMTLEQGKPLAESRGEVVCGASFIEWFAEEGKRAYCDTIPLHAADNSSVRCDQELEASLLGGVQQRAVAERVPPIGLRGVDGVPGQRAGQPFGVPWSKRTSTGWSVCQARALRHELENRCHLLACHVELFDDLVNAEILEVFDDRSGRQPGALEHPDATDSVRDALDGGALGPVKCCRNSLVQITANRLGRHPRSRRTP